MYLDNLLQELSEEEFSKRVPESISDKCWNNINNNIKLKQKWYDRLLLQLHNMNRQFHMKLVLQTALVIAIIALIPTAISGTKTFIQKSAYFNTQQQDQPKDISNKENPPMDEPNNQQNVITPVKDISDADKENPPMDEPNNQQNVITSVKDISDADIVELIKEADTNVKNLSTIYNKNSYVKIDELNMEYCKLSEKCTSYDMLYNYLNKELNLNDSFSDDFIKWFINKLSVAYNGEYYLKVGDFGGYRIDYNSIKVKSRELNGNNLSVTVTLKWLPPGEIVPDEFESKEYEYKLTLSYVNDRWLISEINLWGF